jgi:hypothetical protein
MTEPFILRRQVADIEQRLRDDRPTHIEVGGPFIDTPLVAFFRRNQFRIAVACFCVATAAGCYMAFRIGYGVGVAVFG